MSDLVQRLRKLASGSMAGFPQDTCLEAAAEIERLTPDAARWDYCREATPDLERFCGCTADELDRAVDAARGVPGAFFGAR